MRGNMKHVSVGTAAALLLLSLVCECFYLKWSHAGTFPETARTDIHRDFLTVRRGWQKVRDIDRTAGRIMAESGGRISPELARQIVQTIDGNIGDGITREMVLRMCRRESHWDRRAIGKQGERGLMQIKGYIARQHDGGDLFDPVVNIQCGIAELRRLSRLYGSAALGIALYAGGTNKALSYARDIISLKSP